MQFLLTNHSARIGCFHSASVAPWHKGTKMLKLYSPSIEDQPELISSVISGQYGTWFNHKNTQIFLITVSSSWIKNIQKSRRRELNYWLKGYIHDIKLDYGNDGKTQNVTVKWNKCYRSYKCIVGCYTAVSSNVCYLIQIMIYSTKLFK